MDVYGLLIAAGILAGAMNAMAGGGSFVTLPVLIATGMPSVTANASSTVALYPGGVASAWVLRHGVTDVGGVGIGPTFIVALVGGLAGAILLLTTPTSVFDSILPWLLLIATTVLAAGPRLGNSIRSRFTAEPSTILAVQFMLGVYGGYFGGAVGLMMMAIWSMLDGADMKALAPMRTLLVTATNTVAVVWFAAAGAVSWTQAIALGIGALAGGAAGAKLTLALDAGTVRLTTVIFASVVTTIFFARAYF